ncbi:MAG: Ig-like domain-containing protein [Chlamydiales bacterium]|nr:Ig-like domain-containing protein [Chlamydiales bacterium]
MLLRFVPLEQRLLFDAAIAAVIADAVTTSADSHAEAPPPAVSQAPDSKDSSVLPSDKATTSAVAAPVTDSPGVDAHAAAVRVMVVSSQIPQLQDFISAISSDVIVVAYQQDGTSLQDISKGIERALNGRVADSIAFAGHGQDGEFVLTSDITITKDTLSSNTALQQFWKDIGGMIHDQGRVDFLSCDFTKSNSDTVQKLDVMLDNMTGKEISVAASSDMTGGTKAGANWVLEYGNIAADQLYFNIGKAASWDGILDGLIDISLGSSSSQPSSFTAVGSTVFFVATTTGEGRELWKTDGTAAGTVLVKDIVTGSAGSSPTQLIAYNGLLYFSADSAAGGRELWQSDGTNAGTVQVTDLSPGTADTAFSGMMVVNNTLYFVAEPAAATTYTVYSYDGTTLTQRTTGATVLIDSATYNPAVLGTDIYFQGSTAAEGAELWVYHTTTNIAQQAASLVGGSGSSSPLFPTIFDGKVFFYATTPSTGYEMWSYTPGAASAVLLLDAGQGTLGTSTATISRPVVVNNLMYYAGNVQTSGPADNTLIRTDGTTQGTYSVMDLPNSAPNAVAAITALGDSVFFSADRSTSMIAYEADTLGRELFRSTGGSYRDTVLVKNINPASGVSSLSTTQSPPVAYGTSSLYFVANDGTNGVELWVSDGTNAGTHIFQNIQPGGTSSSPNSLTIIGDKLFLAATGPSVGVELYVYTLADSNVAPVALPLTVSTFKNTTLVTSAANGLLSGVTDADGDTAFLAHLAQAPLHGNVVINSDGSFGYTPDAGYVGSDSFNFYVDDGVSISATNTVQITVVNLTDSVNGTVVYSENFQNPASPNISALVHTANSDSAAANSDLTPSILPGLVSGNTSARFLGFLGQQSLSWSVSSLATHDMLLVSYDLITVGSWDGNGDVNIPQLGQFGPDSHLFYINGVPVLDGTISVEVARLQNFPESYPSTNAGRFSNIGVGTLGYTRGVNPDVTYRVTYLIAHTASSALFTAKSDTTSSGVNPSGPNEEAWGIDNISVTAYSLADLSVAAVHGSSNEGSSSTLTVSLTNSGPSTATGVLIKVASNMQSLQFASAPIGVTYNTLTGEISIPTISSGAVIDIVFNGTVPSGQNLVSTVEVTASNQWDPDSVVNNAAAAEDDIAVATTAINHRPVANSNSYSVLEDTTLVVSAPGVKLNDSDPDGNSFSAVFDSQQGSPIGVISNFQSDGSFVYTPNANAFGTDSFTYHLVDSLGAVSLPTTVTIMVTSVNDAPTFNLGSNEHVLEDSGAHSVANFLTNASPGPAETEALSILVSNNNGVLFSSQPTINLATGLLTYTSGANRNGVAIVIVTVFEDADQNGVLDPGGLSTSQTFTITVDPVNDAPIVNDATFSVQENAGLGGNVGNVIATDVEPGTLTYSIISGNIGNAFGIDGTGSIFVNGTIDYETLSQYTLTVQVMDSGGLVDTAAITINVLDQPSISGYVFEDLDADGSPSGAISYRPGVTVRLYRDNGPDVGNPDAFDTLLKTTTTDLNGLFVFETVPNVTYWISVQSTTLTSSFGFTAATQTAWAEQTYGPTGSVRLSGSTFSYLAAAGSLFGGKGVSASDSNANLATSEHAAKVTLGAGSATNLDFGFSYEVIVNTNGASSSLQGSIRQFLFNSEKLSSAQTSYFHIGAVGSSQVINVNTAGLSISSPVILNALTQGGPGYTGAPLIRLDGLSFSSASAVPGLIVGIGATGSTIEGFSITNFPGSEILVQAADVVIRNNYIGVGLDGVTTFARSVTVSTATGIDAETTATNLLVENNVMFSAQRAIRIAGSATVVRDNFIGVSSDGSTALTFGGIGLLINSGSNIQIIDNIIVRSGGAISISNAVNGAEIYGNKIGVAADGVTAIANTATAIFNNGQNIIIGSATDPTKANIIANQFLGVLVSFAGAVNNSIRGNSIYNNTSLGIDLSPATVVNPNDAGDSDSGANGLQNYPVITSATYSGTDITIVGTLNSKPNAIFAVDLYASTNANVSGFVEGEVFLGTVSVTTNASGDGTFTFTTADVGKSYITATATDAANNTSEFSAMLRLNHIPVATNDSFSGAEDNDITGNVQTNDSDPDGDALTTTLGAVPTNGSVVLNPDGSFTYTPNANYNGTDSFTYTLSDGAKTSTATVSLTITAVNDPPVAVDDAFSGAEDTPITGNVQANDGNVDGDMLTATVDVGPTNGSVVLNPDGSFTYTPNANYNGSDSFTYILSDGAFSSTATVNLTITAVNDPPVAVDDNYSGAEDTDIIGNVQTNDSNVDGDVLTAMVDVGPTNGSVFLNADGSFTYTPNTNYYGSDSFTYILTDGSLNSTATVNLTIIAENDPPVAVDDSFGGAEDTLITGNVQTNDGDPDGDLLTAIVDAGPTNGSVVLNPDGSFTYTPNADYNGTDSFTYILSDGTFTSTATVNLTIIAMNDPPVAVDDSFSAAEDNDIVGNVQTNDGDPDGDILTAMVDAGPTNGSVVLNADGSFTYTPNTNYYGSDSFTYILSDGSLTSTATVNLDITPANDAPVAVNDSFNGAEDADITGSVLANDSDPDGDALSATVDVGPAHGVVILNPDGSFTYTPDAAYNGSDSFTYILTDGIATSTATVSLNVGAVNDPPAAVNDSYAGTEDINITGNILTNDSDLDGDALSATLDVGPIHGTVILNLDGSFTYTPDANYNGADSFTYILSDGTATSTATVSLDIAPVNDPPVAVNDVFSGIEDTPITGNVRTNDSDVDSSSLVAIIVGSPVHGQIVAFNALTGAFTYVPDANFNGVDNFTYNLSDGTSSVTARVRLNVSPVNDAPVAVDDNYNGLEDNAITGNVLSNDSDIDSTTLSALLTVGPIHGMVAFSSSGDFTYTPEVNFFGIDSFTYAVRDAAGGLTDVGNVTITVIPVNDAPTFNLGPDIDAGSGTQTIDPFATGISPGPANEAGQPLHWDIVNDNPALFTSQPTLDALGKLSFTPADHASGVVAVHVTLVDGGGTANGGVDRSTQTFFISLNVLDQNTIGQFVIAPTSESPYIDSAFESTKEVEDLFLNPTGFYGVGGDNQMTSTGEMIGFDSLDYYNSNLVSEGITDLPSNSSNLSSTDFFQINEVLDSARDILGFPIESSEFNMLIDHPTQDQRDLVNEGFNGSLQAMLDLIKGAA